MSRDLKPQPVPAGAHEQPELLPMSLGEQLAAARSRQQKRLPDAARALKCDEQRLLEIEADQPGPLAPVYRRGLVLSYARYLELDVDSIRGQLTAPSEEDPPLEAVGEKGPSLYAADRWLRAASYVLATLLIGTLAWQMTHEAVRLARLENPVTESDPGEVNNETPAPHVAASIAGIEAFDELTPERAGAAGVGAWAALQSLEGVNTEPLQPGEHWIEVRASADSWVEISGREQSLIEQDLLRGGDQRRYRGFAPFRISLGRSSAVELFIDGVPVELGPYTRDNVTQMRLDPDQTLSADS